MLTKTHKRFLKNTIHFLFAFGFIKIVFGDQFNNDLWKTSIKSAALVFFFVLARDFTERDEHVIYSSHDLQAQIINLIEKKGFQLKNKSQNKLIYSKSNFWSRKRFIIEKTDYFLKVALPEEYVDQFEKFVR